MKKILYAILIFIFTATMLFTDTADTAPAGILEFFTDENEITVFDASGTKKDELYFGMRLNEGDRVKTISSTAELRLDPNGSLIRLSYNTDFTIETLQRDAAGANSFTLITGKIRAIAAKTGLFKNNYSIRTPSAVCGVRGTDFGLEAIADTRDMVIVREGLVEFTSIINGQTIELEAGMYADVYSPEFKPLPASQADLETFFSDLQFEKLSPLSSGEPEAEEETDTAEEEAEIAEEPKNVPASPRVSSIPVAEKPARSESRFYNWLSQHMGMEIGTLTIGGTTYSRAILQPVISTGKFRAGLFLPVIYHTNMFDYTDWYKPDGNNEWSFGSDQDTTKDIVKDAFQDLMLKIRFIEYGNQRDPFYLKAGNLGTMTIGHGILMNNYANNIDFPAVRKIGLNTGFNGERFGAEAVVDDISAPSIAGGRLYSRFGGTFGMGGSLIADLYPERGLENEYALMNELYALDLSYGDSGAPIFFTGGIDIDFPLIENEVLSLILFSDIAGMLPYYRYPVEGTNIPTGFALKAIYDDTETDILKRFRNIGLTAGVMGKAALLDYRLEYRHYNGIFRAPFFDSAYERMKGAYVYLANDYLEQVYGGGAISEDYTGTTRGVYGQAGMNIFQTIYLEAGYLLPWNEDGITEDDYFRLVLTVPKGSIPVVKFGASLSYEKYGFVDGIMNNSLFDASAIVRGEIVYPVAPTLDIAGIVTTVINDEGEAVPVISIETRIHF